MTNITVDFFISYNHSDVRWAEWIAWELEASGYTTYVQAWDFLAGQNFVQAMDKGTRECKRTIAVLSPNYLASKFTKPEWYAAFAKDPTGEKGLLIPILIGDCNVEGLLDQIIYIDLVGLDGDQARERLNLYVKGIRRKPTAAPLFPGGFFVKKPNKDIHVSKVLYVCCATDEWYCEQLKKHLSPLRRKFLIEEHYKQLNGSEHLDAGSNLVPLYGLLVCFVSADFLDSHYMSCDELNTAITLHNKGHVTVIPVLVRACFWKITEFNQFDMLPSDKNPIEKWLDVDEAFVDIVKGIYDILRRKDFPEPSSLPANMNDLVEKSDQIWLVPADESGYFTGRFKTVTMLRSVLRSGSPVILYGQTGMGKSSIAVHYAYQNRSDYGLVWWISGDPLRMTADMFSLFRTLNPGSSISSHRDKVRDLLLLWFRNNTNWLLIFDDVSDLSLIESFLDGLPGHIIVTSDHLHRHPLCQAIEVGPWTREESISYLFARTGCIDLDHADRLAARCGDVPLELELVAASVRQGIVA